MYTTLRDVNMMYATLRSACIARVVAHSSLWYTALCDTQLSVIYTWHTQRDLLLMRPTCYETHSWPQRVVYITLMMRELCMSCWELCISLSWCVFYPSHHVYITLRMRSQNAHTATHCNTLTATQRTLWDLALSECAFICRATWDLGLIGCVVLQSVCCSALRCVAVCCSVLQCVRSHKVRCVAVCCSVLQCVAVCCGVSQCVAMCCSVLQCLLMRPTHDHESCEYYSHTPPHSLFFRYTQLSLFISRSPSRCTHLFWYIFRAKYTSPLPPPPPHPPPPASHLRAHLSPP